MIDKEHFTFFHYIDLEPYTGSMDGLRYMFRKEPQQDPKDPEAPRPVLMVYVWPEPFAFAHTPAEQISSQQFEMSEEGMMEGVDWVNRMAK